MTFVFYDFDRLRWTCEFKRCYDYDFERDETELTFAGIASWHLDTSLRALQCYTELERNVPMLQKTIASMYKSIHAMKVVLEREDERASKATES